MHVQKKNKIYSNKLLTQIIFKLGKLVRIQKQLFVN